MVLRKYKLSKTEQLDKLFNIIYNAINNKQNISSSPDAFLNLKRHKKAGGTVDDAFFNQLLNYIEEHSFVTELPLPHTTNVDLSMEYLPLNEQDLLFKALAGIAVTSLMTKLTSGCLFFRGGLTPIVAKSVHISFMRPLTIKRITITKNF